MGLQCQFSNCEKTYHLLEDFEKHLVGVHGIINILNQPDYQTQSFQEKGYEKVKTEKRQKKEEKYFVHHNNHPSDEEIDAYYEMLKKKERKKQTCNLCFTSWCIDVSKGSN